MYVCACVFVKKLLRNNVDLNCLMFFYNFRKIESPDQETHPWSTVYRLQNNFFPQQKCRSVFKHSGVENNYLAHMANMANISFFTVSVLFSVHKRRVSFFLWSMVYGLLFTVCKTTFFLSRSVGVYLNTVGLKIITSRIWRIWRT